ncbi:beta-N-acetylhexosaminidase [Siccirubricoccus sp. KC 17139]|uniref:beta-N-acetylhexosaminidase n=1 Tax=Siccirubricoccus soli TaxID=2899147 RepID=A0ABT1D4C8_9PROT|nr:beta-N-acetylhexosaminidase [Siccirubricoccus soli]MCO6416781.1 beta-N-acetylhexosaminidase [Siccirubricoccus soli]MCP2682916.1 beta-N-acetylhexosaminidase [Siccirubricoccus soli]
MERPRAAIIGLSGQALTPGEVALLRATPPLGIILFARNIAAPAQLRALTASIQELLGEQAPILVDQEGGRVARLRPPHWPAFPPAASFEGGAAEAAEANAALLGLTCRQEGFDVVCAPVLDLRLPGQHDIIGDRAFSADPAEVARLGRAFVQGLQSAGCIPVIKHLPGHGRAMADSHLELPRVAASRDELAADCAPFQALAGSGAWAMTAHILYPAFDPDLPATLSPGVVGQVIRGAIGFDGVLVSDDLCMRALQGQPGALACQAIHAGCDLVLHCNGETDEAAALLAACPALSEAAERRLAQARARMQQRRRLLDPAALEAARAGRPAAA